MNDKIKNQIEKCTTKKQVLEILKKNHIPIVKDTSDEVGSFSIWIDEVTRIYKPYKRKQMVVQVWKKIKMEYSGVPVFFATDSYF